MKERITKIGYQETDKKIKVDIFGLIFEIDEDTIVDKDIRNLNSNNEEIVIKEIEDIIGKDSVRKINEKRNKDGYDNMNLKVQLAVLSCIYEAYINATVGNVVNNVESSLEKNINRANNIGNRKQRRNYNRNRYRRY